MERDQDPHVSVTFILYSSDGTQYESENTEFLSEEGILDTRRISSVEMNYHNYSEGKNISVDLSHAVDSSSSENKVIVSSNDENWADGILKWIEDTISNWQKQKNWPYRYSRLLTVALGIGSSLLLYSILDIVLSQFNPEKARAVSATTSIGLFLLFIGVLAWSVDEWIRKLYPRVEFLTGPEHARMEEQRRSKLGKIILLCVSPLVLSAIFELIKLAIKHL